MALSKERQGELAMLAVIAMKESEGLTLKPKEIKREVKHAADKLKVASVMEIAEFYKIIATEIFEKTIKELDVIINSGKVGN